MRFELKDYQTMAVAEILRNLDRARQDFHSRGDLLAFSLSATTGAGKTVMATAVLEALFEGSENFEIDGDPSAVILWVTDDPSLNEQTRFRILESGDGLDASRLKVIDSAFDQEKFDPANVYFLNVQKLGSATSWVKHTNGRTFTLWDTIANTIGDPDRTLYLVLDEAHRGMRPASKKASEEKMRSTIVQRLVNGDNGVPPVPIVWGISATVQLFAEAMAAAQVEGRITYPAVAVDAVSVQESGLLKDTIILDFPEEKGVFKTTFLRSAIRELKESTELWKEYAEQEGDEDLVVPLMVVQVPNKPKDSELAQMLDVIGEEWADLEGESIAHVFGDHTDLSPGGHTVQYVSPQDVEGAHHIRILLAKDAISTGWDCPRAEVLFSLRPAKDRTHITQLLGRMVRTPLARRVESDERLNSVICYLPLFDQATATDVANVLTGEKIDQGDPGFAGKSGRKALTSPVTMSWNSEIPDDLESFFGGLPSEAAPKGNPKPIKRLLSLAAEVAIDDLMEDPNDQAMQLMFAALDGQLAQNKKLVEAGVEEIYTAEIRRITTSVGESSLSETTYQERSDDQTVDDSFRLARRSLGAAVANAYAKRMALDGDGDDFDIHSAKATLAALIRIDDVLSDVEAEAEQAANSWQNKLRTKIKALPESRRAVYEDIKRQSRKPQEVEIVVPKSRIENTKDADSVLLPTRKLHLLSDENGDFPVGTLNAWEIEVLDTELNRDGFVSWYRNPSAAKSDALQVPYQLGDVWKPMQPDFIFFSRKADGSLAASIVDPHGDHLADALPKLIGLASFAERHSDNLMRVEAVSKVGQKELRMLDVLDEEVRIAIRNADAAQDLYRGPLSTKFE